MAAAPVLYQETRIAPTPTSPSHVLQINTNGSTTVGAVLSAARKRTFEDSSANDEESYARKRLATEGSVFFRRTTRSPRSFLWRVLDDRKLLEVQCVDLVQERKESGVREGLLTFQIPFSAEILRGGVQFADVEEKDALELFVLTSANELYTITLKRDLLLRETIPTGFDSASCVKKFAPSSFTFRHPYRLVAVSNLELYVSLQDGGLMRLEREFNENGSIWRETFFSEGGWTGTIKSWNPFSKPQTVRYGDRELESSAIAAIAKNPKGTFVWTVSLDHTLKAWSTATGRVVAQIDLLGEKYDKDDMGNKLQYVMSAEQGTLLQILPWPSSPSDRSVARLDDDVYLVVVHSPKDHQFKFYRASTTHSPTDGESIDLQDTEPAAKLVPPIDDLLNMTIWHLEHFVVYPGSHGQDAQLWLRARSGSLCKTFTLTFSLIEDEEARMDKAQLWRSGWTVVDADSTSVDTLKEAQEFSGLGGLGETGTTPSDMWLSFLFYPGRFSQASLETALEIYRIGRSLDSESRRGLKGQQLPLKEQITAAISAKVFLRRRPNDQPDYDRYHSDLQKQWATLFALLAHLHNRRHDSVGFCLDPGTGVPWVICADFISPIRSSSAFERLCLNTTLALENSTDDIPPDLAERVFVSDEGIFGSRILAMAQQMRQYLSGGSRQKLQHIASASALDQTAASAAEVSLSSLYQACGFGNEVTSDDFDALESTAKQLGGFGNLTDDDFFIVFEGLEEEFSTSVLDHERVLGRYGDKFSIAVAQETFERVRVVLCDLLALIMFIHAEFESEDLHPQFRPKELYETITMRLKNIALRLWLVRNVREESQKDHTITMTLYESMFIGDWTSQAGQADTTHLLTEWSKRWAFQLNLSPQWEDVTSHIMANLLRHNNIDLAADFLQFVSNQSWHAYLRGRLFLATGQYALASIAFREAADDFETKNLDSFVVDGLLSEEELNLLAEGKAGFFRHVLALFERLKVHSYVVDFAQLALDNFETDEELMRSIADIDLRKSKTNSHMGERIDDTIQEIRLVRLKKNRDDILNRLFNALVQTGRVERAFETLISITTPALQKSCLHALLQTCIRQDCVSSLLELPLRGDLAQEADNILSSLAKKSMAVTTTSSTPQYHKILSAFRVQQADFRGAAAVLYEHLERLRLGKHRYLQDPEDETLVQAYVLLINTLSCCGEENAWLLADPIPGVHGVERKRTLVRLEDVRRDYEAELDKRSDLLHGRFPLVGGDEMDVF